MIYHCYETVENYESKTSSILRNYDIASKALLTIYIAYYFPILKLYGVKCVFNYITLYLLHLIIKNRRTTFTNVLEDSVYVLMIQLPLFKSLELYLDITPTFSCIV